MSPLPHVLLITLIAIMMGTDALAQLSITAIPTVRAGGMNISCNGGNNGEISTIVTGNTGPYSLTWGTSTTLSVTGFTTNLTNGIAGGYWVTVTDSVGHTDVDTVVLQQPHTLLASLDPREYDGGTNISENGENDGALTSNVAGGVTPYTYLWQPGNHTAYNYLNLEAGDYDLTVTDAAGCEAQASITLTEPPVFSVDIELIEVATGYHIVACADVDSGRAIATPAGGVPPYEYAWASTETDSLPHRLSRGEQSLHVTDANGVERTIEFEMLATPDLEVEITTNDLYPNGYHVNSWNSFDATVTATATGGTAPYTYVWKGLTETTNVLENAGEDGYQIMVSDANGCIVYDNAKLSIPERDDWTVNGNSGLNADNTQRWIGTSDSTDLVFKTNNTERVRITANGQFAMDSLRVNHIRASRITSLEGDSLIAFGDSTIFFNHLNEHIYATRREGMRDLRIQCQPWPNVGDGTHNNTLINTLHGNIGVGTSNPNSKLTVAGDIAITGSRLHVNANSGNVGIGTNNPEARLDNRTSNGEPAFRVYANGNVVAGGPFATTNDKATIFLGDVSHYIRSTFGKGLSFGTYNSTDALVIQQSTGNVGIGVSLNHAFAHRFEVCGTIRANKVLVESSWCDFVFEKGYRLRPLQEVKAFIEKHKHLPDVPSAKTIETQGLDLGDLVKRLTLKVEELTLYTIELEERIVELSKVK